MALLFGGLPDKALTCAFVAGLPDAARQSLRASSRMEALPLEAVLARARAIMADDFSVAAAADGMSRRATGRSTFAVAPQKNTPLCYECHQPNHLARDCLLRQKTSAGRNGRQRRCYRCGSANHLASACQGNGGGEELSAAPAPSPPNNL